MTLLRRLLAISSAVYPVLGSFEYWRNTTPHFDAGNYSSAGSIPMLYPADIDFTPPFVWGPATQNKCGTARSWIRQVNGLKPLRSDCDQVRRFMDATPGYYNFSTDRAKAGSSYVVLGWYQTCGFGIRPLNVTDYVVIGTQDITDLLFDVERKYANMTVSGTMTCGENNAPVDWVVAEVEQLWKPGG